MLKKIVLLTLLLSSLINCSKKELTYNLEGTVLTGTIEAIPVEGAKLELYAYPLGATTPQLLGEFTTSSSGKYNFTIPRERVVKYELRTKKDNYFNSSFTINFSDLTTEKENTIDVPINPIAWVKIRLNNSISPATNDEIKLLKTDFYTDCNNCCSNGYEVYNGILDTSLYCATLAQKYVRIHHWVNETETYKYDSLYTKALDTVFLTINY